MEAWLQESIYTLFAALALPQVGLPAIFVVSLVSATLLPLGSEPAVFAYVQVAPHMFWPAIAVATAGNTIGGVISYATGVAAHLAWDSLRHLEDTRPEKSRKSVGGRWHSLSINWFKRLGPAALLLSWLPIVGDPLCAVAGWLRLSFWPSVMYMAIGKCLRYIIMTAVLIKAWPALSVWF